MINITGTDTLIAIIRIFADYVSGKYITLYNIFIILNELTVA